jgi:hypothetical protein
MENWVEYIEGEDESRRRRSLREDYDLKDLIEMVDGGSEDTWREFKNQIIELIVENNLDLKYLKERT